MGSLFGGGKAPDIQMPPPANIQAAAVETDASNAGLFERMKRAAAYGRQKTMMTPANMSDPRIERKKLMGVS